GEKAGRGPGGKVEQDVEARIGGDDQRRAHRPGSLRLSVSGMSGSGRMRYQASIRQKAPNRARPPATAASAAPGSACSESPSPPASPGLRSSPARSSSQAAVTNTAPRAA